MYANKICLIPENGNVSDRSTSTLLICLRELCRAQGYKKIAPDVRRLLEYKSAGLLLDFDNDEGRAKAAAFCKEWNSAESYGHLSSLFPGALGWQERNFKKIPADSAGVTLLYKLRLKLLDAGNSISGESIAYVRKSSNKKWTEDTIYFGVYTSQFAA